MCTVSFIANEQGYVLTSNRDEAPGRATAEPEWWSPLHGVPFRAPVDLEKKGTWIAAGEDGRSACLLNGAFEKHRRVLPYTHSRGALIPWAFEAENFRTFYNTIDLEGFEPFTLILVDELLQVLRWDGKRRVLEFLSKERSHLWSSATLYTPDDHALKLRQFETFFKVNPQPDPDDLLRLHGVKRPNDFILRREEVRTVSITQVVAHGNGSSMQYLQPSYLFNTL